MNIFRIIILAIMGFVLVNCDNSQSTVSDIKQKVEQTGSDVGDKAKDLIEQTKLQSEDVLNKIKEGNYSLAQDMLINDAKLKLPKSIDETTTLVDVSKENGIISYKYVVKGVTKEALQTESNQKSIFNNLLALYCDKDLSMKTLKLVFPDGASHNYYINDEKVLTMNLKPSDCNVK